MTNWFRSYDENANFVDRVLKKLVQRKSNSVIPCRKPPMVGVKQVQTLGDAMVITVWYQNVSFARNRANADVLLKKLHFFIPNWSIFVNVKLTNQNLVRMKLTLHPNFRQRRLSISGVTAVSAEKQKENKENK